jgi:hypothetical protein
MDGHATVCHCAHVLGIDNNKTALLPAVTMSVVGQYSSWGSVRLSRLFTDGTRNEAAKVEPEGWKRVSGALWGVVGSDVLYNSCVPSDCNYLACGDSSIIILHYATLLRLCLATGTVLWRIPLPCRAICWSSPAQEFVAAWILMGQHSQLRGVAIGEHLFADGGFPSKRLVVVDASNGHIHELQALPLPRELWNNNTYGETIT